MNNSDNKEGLFTLPASYVMEQLEETDRQLVGSQFLLQHFFDSSLEKHRLLIPTVVDILWLNFGIVKLLKPYVEDPIYFDNPDTKEKDYMIDQAALLGLQTLVGTRYHVNKELNRLSYSIGIH